MKHHLAVLEFVERANTHKELGDLTADFAGLIEGFGFNSFILTGLPKHGNDVEPLVICNRWPVSWADRYREKNYFVDDPVSHWSFLKRRPFRWRQAQMFEGGTRRNRQIAGEAWDHGLADGIAYPIRDQPGGAVISLAAEGNIDVDTKIEASLFLAVSYYKMWAEGLVRPTAEAVFLTPREKEILSWSAEGKSAWDISCILDISESTVRSHRAAIRRKLGVATTTQAVAKGVLSDKIRL